MWSKLEDKITRPCTKPIQYRETHATVFADNKLWFFGLRGVESATGDSMAWRETSLVGSFVSIYDLKTKKWDFKMIDKVDDNEKHREAIFAVQDKILMLVYSIGDCCNKLYTWNQDKWNEVKLENVTCEGSKQAHPTNASEITVISAVDGVFIVRNGGAVGEIDKLEISVANGEVKHAKCSHVTSADLNAIGAGARLSTLAFNRDKLVVWYVQNKCGFWWAPSKPLAGDLKSGALHQTSVADPQPPYAYSGPREVVNYNNKCVMLGGSKAAGLGHIEDCHEVWCFDINSNTFHKSNLTMMENVPQYRLSFAVDYTSGNVYACDLETGIYVTNLNGV